MNAIPFSFRVLACRILMLGLGGAVLAACEQAENGPAQADPAAEQQTAVDEPMASGIRLDYMDTSVDPAQDFYRYANGAWLAATEIPADKARYGAFIILRDQARDDVKAIIQNAGESPEAETTGTEAQQIGDFYQSFMDTETVESRGLAPIQPVFAEIDGLQNFDALTPYFATASARGITTPLDFYINTDEKQPDRYITYFVHSGLGLPDRDYYLKDDDKSEQLRQGYRQHIAAMFDLAGLPDGEAAAETIVAMETAIAERHWPRTELRDREKTYNKFARDELVQQVETMNWDGYLEKANLGKADDVVLTAPDYFAALDEVLNQFSLEDWRTYLKWHALSSYANLLPEAIDRENFNFYGRQLRGVESQEERWKRAVNLLNGLLGDAVGKLYVDKHFSPAAKARMEELVENLRTAYRQSIRELDWMTEATQEKAIEKLEKFRPKIGYPDKWKDLSSLKIRPDDLFGNYVRARQFYADYETGKLGGPVNRDEWFMSPQTVNAYYNPGMNEIVFPAAILQPPFFNMAADDAINYGAIGAVIGHEMGHGFDDQGAKSDGDGMLRNWWTDEDLAEFEARTEKLVAQYDAYEPLEGVNINGSLTQGENIGDLGGLTIAYEAYQLSLDGEEAPQIDGFTGEQRFFLGWAQVWANKYREEELRRRIVTDPHSPPEYRTNGVVRNMPQFYSAFGVEEGDAMYLPPEDRVKIW